MAGDFTFCTLVVYVTTGTNIAYLIAAIAVTLNALKGHSSLASLLYCTCASADKILTIKAHREVLLQQQSFL